MIETQNLQQNIHEFSKSIPAIGAIFIALITATFASLKFFSDKSAKITDFRKAWIETLRLAVAEFSGSTHTIVGRISIRMKHEEEKNQPTLKVKDFLDYVLGNNKITSSSKNFSFDKDFESELLNHWSILRLSYNKIILHINPSEHQAYILAEKSLALFFKQNKISDNLLVTNFLKGCIKIAEDKTFDIMNNNPFGRKINFFLKKKKLENFDLTKRINLLVELKNIKILCKDEGSALLLSIFATRQLLHGDYNDVYSRSAEIEKGIQVVDTSAAIVIKGAWSSIKNGEPLYRTISFFSVIIALIFPVIIFVIISYVK